MQPPPLSLWTLLRQINSSGQGEDCNGLWVISGYCVINPPHSPYAGVVGCGAAEAGVVGCGAAEAGVMGCGAAEATGLGFVCFIVINPCVLSANRVDLGFFFVS